jgi:hypothetical protein
LGWESRSTVNFVIEPALECSETPDRSVFEIEFELREPGNYGGCSFVCIEFDDETPLGEHDGCCQDYDKVSINFTQDELYDFTDNEGSSRVNHEFGHALGLDDPDGAPDDVDQNGRNASGSKCWLEIGPWIGVPVLSILHRGYCDNQPGPGSFPWPSGGDLYSFDVNVVPCMCHSLP